MRIELIPSAWKADNLPLIYIRDKKNKKETIMLTISYLQKSIHQNL